MPKSTQQIEVYLPDDSEPLRFDAGLHTVHIEGDRLLIKDKDRAIVAVFRDWVGYVLAEEG